jgi:hypothetical protein
MKCYYVLVHGQLDWRAAASAMADGDDSFQPEGFYCHRHVLASTPQGAQEKAFLLVRDNLDWQTGWLTANAAILAMEAEETTPAPIVRLLQRHSGHTFY